MDISVRDAAREDIERIAEIEKQCFSTPWSEQAFSSQIDVESVFACLAVDGEIAGYAIIDTQILPESELFNIAVAPEYRGKGFSKLLMEYVLDKAKAKGAETVLLEVRVSNNAAIGLYEKYGFVKNGTRKGYYSHPKEDAVLMIKRLSV